MRLKGEKERVETSVNNKPSSPREHLKAISTCRAKLFLADRKNVNNSKVALEIQYVVLKC